MATNTDHYAIVIGIDKYSQLRALRGSNNDAMQFALWLKAEGGVPEENMHIITSPPEFPQNPFDARPVAYQIDDALTRIGLTRPGRIGSRLYFYFAGHGFGPSFDDVGMLMANANEERLGYNIGLRPFRVFLRQSEAFDEIIFILDCCRDPEISVDTSKPGIKPGNVGTGVKVRDFVMMAAAYGEKAFQKTDTDTGEPRGVLTKALIEGLKKPEAADGLGRFTAASVFAYVSNRVMNIAQDPKLKQTPNFDPSPQPEIVFSTIPESQLERVEVWLSVDPKYTGELVLKDNNNLEIVRKQAAGLTKENPWKIVLLRNRWYSLAHVDGGPPRPPQTIILDQVPNPYEFVFK
jgi:Caspase domain